MESLIYGAIHLDFEKLRAILMKLLVEGIIDIKTLWPRSESLLFGPDLSLSSLALGIMSIFFYLYISILQAIQGQWAAYFYSWWELDTVRWVITIVRETLQNGHQVSC